MNNSSGWVKLYRSIFDWEWWDDTNTTKVFIYCLLKANPSDKQWRGISVRRGSFVTSRKHIADEVNLTEQEVRTAIDHLLTTGEITKSSTNKLTMITVTNYDSYQEVKEIKQPTEQPQNQPEYQPANNHNEECNNVRSIDKEIDKPIGLSTKNDSSQVNLFGDTDEPLPPKRKSRKEKPFVPPTEEDVQAYLNEKGITDIDAHYFVNKYESVGWMNGGQPVKNWKALVNTWDRRARGNQTISSNQSPSTKRVDIYGKEIHENLQ